MILPSSFPGAASLLTCQFEQSNLLGVEAYFTTVDDPDGTHTRQDRDFDDFDSDSDSAVSLPIPAVAETPEKKKSKGKEVEIENEGEKQAVRDGWEKNDTKKMWHSEELSELDGDSTADEVSFPSHSFYPPLLSLHSLV